jgi:hypothetical protein
MNPGFRNVSASEMIDSLAASAVGRLLKPLTMVITRNARATIMYEQTQILAFAFAFVRSEEVPGDYAEFGVFEGRTFVEAWRVSRTYGGNGRRFWAFDSFKGLPEVNGIDNGGRFATGEFAQTRIAFEDRVRRAGIPSDHLRVIEGFFDDTLADGSLPQMDRVAVAWVDCDLYASTVPVLEYLTPRLSDGAVLLFDDWYCFRAAPDRGEQRACHEWLERNPQITLIPWRQFHWLGQAFIVRRSDLDTPTG